jgi:hypothetical protein
MQGHLPGIWFIMKLETVSVTQLQPQCMFLDYFVSFFKNLSWLTVSKMKPHSLNIIVQTGQPFRNTFCVLNAHCPM